MWNAISIDPDLPRQRRTVRSGVIYTGLSITLALFALGELPLVDAFFSNVNHVIRAHNDQIVYGVIHTVPFLFVGFGSFAGVYRVLGFLNKAGRSA